MNKSEVKQDKYTEVTINEFIVFLMEQEVFSKQTFGVEPRLQANLNHLKFEVQELKGNYDDLTEWADVVIIGLDGAMRAGLDHYALAMSLFQITQTIEADNLEKVIDPYYFDHTFDGHAVGFVASMASLVTLEKYVDNAEGWAFFALSVFTSASHFDITPRELFTAMQEKLAVNRNRTWRPVDSLGPNEPNFHISGPDTVQ